MSRFPQYGNVFGGASNTTGRNELVSFNAGKMNVRPSSNGKFLVTPDLKKGKVCLTRGDDQLLHFQWIDRQSGASQEDFIIFPNDAKFIKVDTGREGDRVYLLQYNNSTRRFFFWMQNKDNSKDEELTKKLNDSMNSATGGGASGEASGTGRSTGAGGNGNIQLDHNAIMQMLGAMGGGDNARGASTGNAGGNSAVQMADLQNILQNMGLPGSTAAASSPAPSVASSSGRTAQSVGASSAAATTTSQQGDMDVDDDEMTEEELLRLAIAESMRDSAPDAGPSQAAAPTPPAPVSQPPAPTSASSSGGGGITAADLERAMASIQSYAAPKKISITKLLSAENVAPLLNDQSVVNALLQHLPEGAQNKYELRETLHSPQFRQSIRSLVHALQSGNFNAVLASFGLDPNAGATKLAFGDGVGAFLDAILQGAKTKECAAHFR